MMNITFTGIEASLRAKQSRIETEERMAKAEAEIELLMALFAEEEVVEVTQEDIEAELMEIEDYREFVLDINEDEVAWINDNIDLSHLIGAEDNTVTALSKLLKISVTKVRRLVRTSLGYRRGSDYQNNQKQYVDELIEDFRHNLYEDLEKQLRKARLYDFYRALLDYTKNRVSVKPLSKDENELTFFVMYPELVQVCKEFGITRGLDNSQLRRKLEQLCELGLLTNLEDNQIDPKTLAIARSIARSSSKKISKSAGVEVEISRRNHYVLNDLSPEVQDEAIARVKLAKEYGLRSKDKNSTSLALVYGEEVQKEITAQGQANISEAKLRNFNKAAQALIEKQGYFTEEELRKQFIKIDRNTKKADSYDLTRTYLAITVISVNCIKTRVNNNVRKEHNLPKKIKSNSFVFIPK